MKGASQLASIAALPPANPSREKTAAAVQLGTATAIPSNVPKNVVDLLLVFSGVVIVVDAFDVGGFEVCSTVQFVA
jgi:hypothetical protein